MMLGQLSARFRTETGNAVTKTATLVDATLAVIILIPPIREYWPGHSSSQQWWSGVLIRESWAVLMVETASLPAGPLPHRTLKI